MIDIEVIKSQYGIANSLQMEDILVLLETAKAKVLSSGDFLLEEGYSKKEIYFIQSGLIRIYFVDDEGAETTLQLRWENHFFGLPDVLFKQIPSRYYIEALEETQIFVIGWDKLQSLLSENEKLQKHRPNILHYIIAEQSQRLENFVLLSPEERYLDFIESNPDILNRVPNKFIANVLGITPVSLSRIRKRIATKK